MRLRQLARDPSISRAVTTSPVSAGTVTIHVRFDDHVEEASGHPRSVPREEADAAGIPETQTPIDGVSIARRAEHAQALTELTSGSQRGQRDGRADTPMARGGQRGHDVDSGGTGPDEERRRRNGLAIQATEEVSPWHVVGEPDPAVDLTDPGGPGLALAEAPRENGGPRRQGATRSITSVSGPGSEAGSWSSSMAMPMSAPDSTNPCRSSRSPRSRGRMEGPTCQVPGTP